MLSGIYMIKNNINLKTYIGSSINIPRRKKEHFNDLRKNKHFNKKLQYSFNKYKEENFSFIILENCEKSELLIREQWYVDNLKPFYNICIIDVSCPIGVRKFSEEDIENCRAEAFIRLKENNNFGWKSRKILQLGENKEVIKEYESLKEYAKIHKCSIASVGKALKKNNRCKGFYVTYKP